MKRIVILPAIFFFSLLHAQKVTINELCKLDKALNESSGIVVAGGKIWSHNDSQGQPVLYGFDNTGKVSDIIYISGKNTDWEDMAKDDAGNLYIGDFGNDKNKRHDLKIYKISNPETLKENIAKPEVIEFKYSDQRLFPPDTSLQNFDMEAMVWFNSNIYLFSKNRTNPFTGVTKVYKLPDQPGSHVAQLVDSVYLGPAPMITSWVTSADISPDKTKLALLGHDKVWLFTCFDGDKFFSGKNHTISINGAISQKEALCFVDNQRLYITDEIVMRVVGGKLYTLDLTRAGIVECN